MTNDATPKELLKIARDLLMYADPDTAGLWPRATALLARQSLEAGMRTFWTKQQPGVESASGRAQLLCLRGYLPAETAADAAQAWAELSRATHHHAYELPPTVVELKRACEAVQGVLAALNPEEPI